MGDGIIVLTYMLAGGVLSACAHRIAEDFGDQDRFGLALATFFFWPLALAVGAILFVWALFDHRERLLIFTEEGRLHARARRARRDMRLLELRREAEEAEERYRRSLDRMIEEASR